MTAPPSLTVTGTAAGLFGNLSGGTALTETALYGTAVTFVSNVPADQVVVWESRLERVPPVVAYFSPDGTLKRNGDPVKLLANDDGLNVAGLQWTCIINGIEEFTFDADGDVDLSSVINVPNVPVVGTPFTEASIIALLANSSSPIREALDALYESGADGSVTFAKLAAALVVTSTETIAANNNNTTIPTSAAVVAYVATAFINFVAGAPGALDTWLELVAAIQSDETGLATLTTLIGTLNIKRFGVVGDGSTNDTAAIATAMAAGVPLRFPPGTYLTTAPIIQRNASVVFDPGVTIKATASMAALWQVGTSSITAVNKCLHGASTILDCNDLASIGLSLYAFQHFEASSITASQTALHGIVVGDPGATFTPFEAILDQVHTKRRAYFDAGTSALTPPTGGRGLWIRTATDGEYSRMDLVGNETGVRADTDNNRFAQIHPWGYQGYLPVTSFDDHGNHNKWIGCGADSPSNQGWSINGVGTTFIGCNLYVNEFVTDDTVVGVKVESANANLTVVGMSMLGKDSSHRVHQDFGGAHGVESATIIGHSNVNVVNQNVYQVSSLFGAKARFNSDVKFAETGTPVLVTDGADTAYFSVNTSTDATYGKQIAAVNGADLAGWSDNYSTLKWKLKGLTGVLVLGGYATGSLPSASTAGAGAQAFDTTKKIPVWSDGSAWHDGLGPTPTLTSPRIGTAIQDSAGNSILILSPSASAVNYIGMTNAPATGTPSFYAGGSDTNVGLDIWTQGTSRVRINGNPAGVKVGVPASSSAAGAPGDWAADASWHYDCINTNTWVRSAAATW